MTACTHGMPSAASCVDCMTGIKVVSVNQQYAALIMAGTKQFETRPSPPNGDMRPDGVRGLPGAQINRGDRIAIHATQTKLDPFEIGMTAWRPLMKPGSDVELAEPLTLGAILGTVQVPGAIRIDPDGDNSRWIETFGDGLYLVTDIGPADRPADSFAIEDITDQLPFGDWQPGRWAWELADPEPFAEPIPAKGKQGVWTWDGNP